MERGQILKKKKLGVLITTNNKTTKSPINSGKKPTTEMYMFKNNIIGVSPKYFTSKEAIFILGNEDSRSWWFDFNDPLYGFFVIDYLPLNSPSLEVGFGYTNKEDGYNRVKEMTEDEGWEFIKGEEASRV